MANQPCQHHWIIRIANGPKSRGVCKLCKEVREFRNSISAEGWPSDAKMKPKNKDAEEYEDGN